MINKELTLESLRKRALHDSFLTMLNACIIWPEKWDAGEVLDYWWDAAFPANPMTEEDYNDDTIDTIRIALLIKGGIKNPTLEETKRTQIIKQEIIFTEE